MALKAATLSREDGWRRKRSTTASTATGSMPPDHPVAQYWGLVSAGLANLDVDSDATLLLADIMRDVGFVNATTRIFYVPIGR